MTKRNPKARLMRAASFMLISPVTKFLTRLFPNWRLGIASLTGILVLALVGIFTAEFTRPTADYLRDGFFDATAKAGLHVTDITVEGRRRTQREDLLAVTQIVAGMPILRVDLDAMQTRIEKLPWVYNVTVVRRLPGIIHLHVREREPFALYEEGRKTALIDKSGDVIIRNHLQTFEHLPVLSGSGAPIRAQALMDMLQDYPVVRNRLVAAEWIGGRRWSLTLDHGGAVHLPAKNMQNALNRLMDLERERRILAVENQSIDLRLPDRILLRPMGETSRAAPPRPKREKRS
ncbi:MAG: FtsQ-type POTRA domain-containing protein [Pseudomonadota bacterium]|nr:FtsQ-type POTRA domain-containing protein [Pseudomonadota bacterium]